MAKEWWEDAPVAQEKPAEWWKDAPVVQAPEAKAGEWWESAPVVKAEPKPEDQSVLRSVADVPLKAVSGLATGVRFVADAFGAGSDVSNSIKGVENYIGELYSAQSKKDSAEISRIMKDAEDKGVGEQVKAAVKAFTIAPIDAIVNGLGTSAPAIVAGLGASVLGAGALAATAVGAGVGSIMGAGTIKSTIYDAVKEELGKTNMPKEQIEARAQAAQDYNGENLDQILMGSALGAIGASTGFEPAVARQVAKQIIAGSVKKQAAVTGLKEFAGEAAQGGQEQLAQNIALQREGYDVPTMRGVVGQATMEGLTGAGLGAAAGASEGLEARRAAEAAPTQEPATPRQEPLEVEKVAADLAQQGITDIDPERVAQFQQTFQDMGLDPGSAQYRAIEAATLEAEEKAPANEEAQGEPDVGQTIAEPSGVSVPVAGQPDTDTTAGGTGIAEPSGVVPARQDVAGTVAGETVQPVAVDPIAVAKRSADSAIADQGNFESLEESIGAYRDNIADSMREQGVDDQPTINTAIAAYDEEINKQKAPTQEVITEPAAGQAKSDDVIAEEAEIPESVANVVGDITTLPTEETEVETAPKGKVGRKPLTPEQKAASDKLRSQQTKNYKENEKAVIAAEAALNEALAPINEELVSSDEALSAAERTKRIDKIQAIKSLLLLERSLKGTKPGDQAAALLKNPAITKMELENVRKGIAAQVSKAVTEVKAGRADSRFSKMTTAQQALRHVIKTGNAFQKFLAQRLLPFVKDVNFQVIEEGAPLPSQITEGKVEADWNESRGMFLRIVATNERFVFVRGVSGGPNQGVNNVTVLHEMLHAALNEKIAMADEAIRTGKDLKSDLVKAFRALQGTMDMTLKRVKEMSDAGTLPEFMGELVVSDIFGDPREFVAYAMSNPRFQKFLMETEGVIKQSLFTRFVSNVRQFFNMATSQTSALGDVITLTDAMLTSRLTANMRAEIAGERASASAVEISSELKKKKEKTNKILVRMEKSSFADIIRDLPLLVNLRSMQDFTDALSSMYAGFDNFKLRQLLPALQTEAVVQWADRLGVKGIKESWQNLGDMAAMRNKLTADMVPVSESLAKLARNAPEQLRRLANVMHYSTLLYRDPTVAGNLSKDADLKKLWDGLTDANKKLYEQVRDFYKGNHEQYHVLLEEQIANSKLAGTAKDGKSPKGKLIAQIKQIYEDGKKLYPYFPLMRYGQYWLRIGKGVNREFYMFENAFDRNMFLRKRVRQMQEAGSTESLREMQESKVIDLGNDLSDARKRDLDASGMLKEIFNSIDAGVKAGKEIVDDFGNVISSMSSIDAEKLKDEIYQMYLQTLPDRNFRRQYMHRQGTIGFSGDIARNFAVTGTNMANQLARIKYGPRIMGELERANDTLEGNPDKARLSEFVSEMRMRAEQQVRPDSEDSLGYKTSALLNSSAYLWLMTSVKTAATQLTALPIFVGPVLTSNHGFNPIKVGAALTKSMAIFGTSGIRRQAEDGSTTFEFPSYLNNGLVKLTNDQKLAAQYMADRGISDNTLAYDLGNRRDTPTTQLEGGVRRTMRTVSNVMTSLFHHTERMIREVTFMTSYDLYSQQTNKETGKKYTHEEALRAAEAETHEALGNYHASNRPRGLLADSERQLVLNAQKPIGRTILQFKMFPAFVTTFFMRNAYRALAGLDAKDRAKAMTQLVGALTMSTALAGYVGIPGATMAMGAIQGMLNAMRGDDEDDPLEGRDLEFWFRNIWLPQTFGNIKIGDHTLDEVLDRGLIATMTGYDISGSLSMNNMWVPDVKEQATSAAAMQEYFMSLLGPSASITFKQIPTAIDFFNKGEIARGIEQLAPAFARGSFTAYRYGKEGATTTSGAAIKEAEEFTQGQLLAQSMGFATEGLVARREAIFHLQGEILKVKRERTSLLDRLERELDKGSDEDIEKAFDKIFKFNSKNPYDMIGGDNIKQSIKKQMERKMKSDRGMPIDKKYYPQLIELLEPSEKKLERERLMAQ
tara:strand:- start:610 stop:6564 length:5955 start_codon:yes stop_codon:yes gene_type:complete